MTGRSVSAVSIDWADALDDVAVAGYVVYRDGTQVGTTYQPGFTDTAPDQPHAIPVRRGRVRRGRQRLRAAVAAVTANTLAEPDVSPPTRAAAAQPTSQSMTRIVLAWNASHDNVGVAGYEVYRNEPLIANVTAPRVHGQAAWRRPRSTATPCARLTPPTTRRPTATWSPPRRSLPPDTTPPTAPTGVSAAGTSPTTIDVSWTASSDNVGVALYRVLPQRCP